MDSINNYPQKTAIIDEGGKRYTTYGELYIMACRVVGYLNSLQLPAHSFIGICLPTSMEYIASEIGIWLAGHAIMPMGDEFPQSRINQMMEHSESPLLIDAKEISDIYTFDPLEPLSFPQENDICSLFYTSGSTGNPKGVLHSFRSFGIPLFPDEMFKELNASVMAVTAPMFFVACKLIYDFLTRGETVNIVPPTIRLDIRKLEDFIAAQKIEFVFIPPSVLPHFHNKSNSLKVVFTASERVSGVGPKGYKLVNYCGQTETAGIGCTFMVDKPYDNTPIGIPVSPYIYSVRNDIGEEVSPGEEGELCYKGDLTPGYLKDAERTAELYRDGWLHTGDIVRARPDGNLIYVNRKDWMMKINGQRVEPNEVEIVLKKMPEIDNAIVKGFTSSNNRQYLCAYYITEKSIAEEDIHAYLSSKLPSYMVPAYFIKMDKFPINMNGKLDRKSLQSPIVDVEIIERVPYEAPQNSTEELLCHAFEESLGYSHIGVNEDFFLLGGDSIRVMKLQTLCQELPLSARMIYVHRTPRNIAKACKLKTKKEIKRHNDYPLSKTQMGIYVESMLHQGETIYNNSVLYRLGTNVDVNRLSCVINSFIDAHPFLKMRLYVDEKGNPRQARNDSLSYVQQIETVSERQFEKIKLQLVKPFNLFNEQLFRIRIIVTPSSSYLFMDFHHIIFDGYSFNILINDISSLYDGKEVEIEKCDGFQIALEEQLLKDTEAYSEARSWNQNTFGLIEVESLPAPDVQSEEIVEWGTKQLKLTIDYQRLSDACKKYNVTPNVLMIAAFGYLLGGYSYSDQSLFASIYNGRKDFRTSRTVGMLVKTLAVYCKWDKDTTIYDYLQLLKHQLLGSMNNDLFSFAELKEINRHITSRVLFAYQGDLDFPNTLCGEHFEQIPIKPNATGEPLAVEVWRKGNNLQLHAEYASNLYSSEFINNFLEAFNTILLGFTDDNSIERKLTSVSLLNDSSISRVINIGRGEKLDYDSNETFISRFASQVHLTPNVIAVRDSVSQLSYAELDHQSNVLADILVRNGVVANSFVAIMLPRKKEFVVSVLAIMKVGAAYVPLDDKYPYSRIEYILNDASIKVILSTKEIHEQALSKVSANIVNFEDIDFSVSACPVSSCYPESFAYMIYTSGSTGVPKGVVVKQSALQNFITWLSELEQLKLGDQCALHTSFCFDGSMFDLFPPLVCGATLHILSDELRQDMQTLYDYIKENHIVGLLLTTQLGMSLMEQYDLPLRFLMVGGEKLTDFKPSSVSLYNCYGPTEFTVCSSYYKVNQSKSYKNIPIGKSVPNCCSYVVDMTGNLLPYGAVGELCLSGRQLSNGYWNREELTEEKFVDNPFEKASKMYRTGDLVKWNKDGELEYHGRIDNLIKLRGYRIELGEIECKIRSFSGVLSSAVIVHTIGKLQYLVGFYCSKQSIVEQRLLDYLRDQLPDYMVPQILIQLEDMPITFNGKIDYNSLHEKVNDQYKQNIRMVTPVDKKESALYEIIKEILGTNQFGVTDDLTMLGMTSIMAIKMSFLAGKEGLHIKVNTILKYKTIRDIIAQDISMCGWENEYSPEKPIAVLIQGMTSYQQLEYLKDELCSNYSVLLVEPINDHLASFHKQGVVLMSEVIDFYVDYISAILPQNSSVSLFIGHSFGGELAYRCAVRWEHYTGNSPVVCLLDTYSNLNDVLEHSIDNHTIPVSFDTPMPNYKGQVLLFKATRQAEQLRFDNKEYLNKANEDKWHTLVPNLTEYLVDADHFKMLEKPFTEGYIKHLTNEYLTIFNHENKL